MEFLFKIIGSLCITAYILGLLANMVNVNYTQKAIRLTFALFLITNIFVPLKSIDFAVWNFDIDNNTDTVNAQEYVIYQASEVLKEKIKTELNSQNIAYSDVYVHINEETDGIYVDYIKITGTDVDEQKYIADIFENEGKIIFGD